MATLEAATPVTGWPLAWPGGAAHLRPVGGALQELELCLPSGLRIRPLAQAPWRAEGLSGHLAALGGEWPCVPFGSGTGDPAHHGYGSDHAWRLVSADVDSLQLAIDYPDDHPVARVERTLQPVPGGVQFVLRVLPRRDCRLPVGVHPILAWPRGGLRLRHAGPAEGRVFPHVFEQGASRQRAHASFTSLRDVPLSNGGGADLAAEIHDFSEELVQIQGGAPAIELDYLDEGYGLHLEWEAAAFPGFLLWLSNGGRRQPPWNGAFRGIGVEPCCAAFDDTALAPAVPGHWTAAQTFTAGKPWTTRYRLTLHELTGNT